MGPPIWFSTLVENSPGILESIHVKIPTNAAAFHSHRVQRDRAGSEEGINL